MKKVKKIKLSAEIERDLEIYSLEIFKQLLEDNGQDTEQIEKEIYDLKYEQFKRRGKEYEK